MTQQSSLRKPCPFRFQEEPCSLPDEPVLHAEGHRVRHGGGYMYPKVTNDDIRRWGVTPEEAARRDAIALRDVLNRTTRRKAVGDATAPQTTSVDDDPRAAMTVTDKATAASYLLGQVGIALTTSVGMPVDVEAVSTPDAQIVFRSRGNMGRFRITVEKLDDDEPAIKGIEL